MHGRNATLRSQTGNDHRLFGLWHYGIPTIHQPFTFITAPYFRRMSEFLSRPQDVQTRSALVLTRIDSKMLRLWGVRYVITDNASSAGREVALLPISPPLSLHVIELEGANLGDYSPTTTTRVDTFHDGLTLMHAAAFDATKTVITDATDEALTGPLQPATDAHLIYETYGFHIEARSPGKSGAGAAAANSATAEVRQRQRLAAPVSRQP